MQAEETRVVYVSDAREIDPGCRELRMPRSCVPMGARAFEIIEVLARLAGEPVTKGQLINRIWPYGIVADNTLQVHAVAVPKGGGRGSEVARALEDARGQSSQSRELRTATSLLRLWRHHGRASEARDLVATPYTKFTEGFGTGDLGRARTVLVELEPFGRAD